MARQTPYRWPYFHPTSLRVLDMACRFDFRSGGAEAAFQHSSLGPTARSIHTSTGLPAMVNLGHEG